MNNNWLIMADTNLRYTFEREDDGRWIAIFDGVPGAAAYGDSFIDAEKRLDALIANIAREQAAELAAMKAERDRLRAELAEAGARLSYATQLVADGLDVARIGSELATADQLGEWWNVQGFQDEAAYFLAGGWATAPTTPPGGEE